MTEKILTRVDEMRVSIHCLYDCVCVCADRVQLTYFTFWALGGPMAGVGGNSHHFLHLLVVHG